MPIKIPQNLPAAEVLQQERIQVIREDDALHQDIRPLRIALLNLMPDKIQTETQLLRAIGVTPLQIEMTLLRTGSYTGKTTPKEHLLSFYKTWEEVNDEKFDALIVTGAPLGQVPFEEVQYWPEMQEILEWTNTHVYASFFICWGAQAAAKYFHDVEREQLEEKKFGLYRHHITDPYHPLTAGFDDTFSVPVSRHTSIPYAEVKTHKELKILIDSEKAGLCMAHDDDNRRTYMFNHLEYDVETLGNEYQRDVEKGDEIALPHNYYPDNNPKSAVPMSWRAHRTLLFTNWINWIYQGTPYNLEDL